MISEVWILVHAHLARLTTHITAQTRCIVVDVHLIQERLDLTSSIYSELMMLIRSRLLLHSDLWCG